MEEGLKNIYAALVKCLELSMSRDAQFLVQQAIKISMHVSEYA